MSLENYLADELDILKVKDQKDLYRPIKNLKGFKTLIDKKVKNFKRVISDIDKELSIVKKKI